MNLNKEIWRLSFPAVVSNITVPLLGLCDTAISGHMGAVEYIGAIAVGAMMVNPIFWLFGFLRMGTSGLTAQAYGSGNRKESGRLLTQSVSLGCLIGIFLCILRYPLGTAMLSIMDAPLDVSIMAKDYFITMMWASPALLGTMSVMGWMLGMQNTLRPMIVSIGVNALNIPLSLTLVYGFGLGFGGIALGTTIADWVGFITALLLARPLLKGVSLRGEWKSIFHIYRWSRFFKVNSDILLRSACIMAVSVAMTAYASHLGGLILAANALMLQFFHTFSYFMDGLAFTAEALCGKFAGASDIDSLRKCIQRLLLWTLVLVCIFTLLYGMGAHPIAAILTSQQDVVKTVSSYWYWIASIPLISAWAFIYDGIFIGLTATRRMLITTIIASSVFFIINFLVPRIISHIGLDILWISFISYLFTRGIILAWLTPSTLNKSISNKITC